MTPFSMLGTAVAGFVYDATGSYAVPFGAAPVVVVISGILFALATRSARPVPVVSQGG